jgi:hypothetical protein
LPINGIFLSIQELLKIQDARRFQVASLQRIVNGLVVAFARMRSGVRKSMTLRIERISGKGKTRIRLSGEFRSEHVDQVKAEIERGRPRVALDLEEVGLVDVEGVRFLNRCQADGISVLHCSPYIREWMLRERPKTRTNKRKKGQVP